MKENKSIEDIYEDLEIDQIDEYTMSNKAYLIQRKISKNKSLEIFVNDTPRLRSDIQIFNDTKRSASNILNLELTPLKTTNNFLENNKLNEDKSPDDYLKGNIAKLKETNQQQFKNAINTSTISNKYFTISSAAGLKFRQIIKKYVQ